MVRVCHRIRAVFPVLALSLLLVTGCTSAGSTGVDTLNNDGIAGGYNSANDLGGDTQDKSYESDNYSSEDYSGESSNSDTGESQDIVSKEDSEKTEAKTRLSKDKMVYTGRVEIESLSYDDSYKKVHDIIEKAEGIIQSENSSDSNDDWYYKKYERRRSTTITVRIPSENFDSFMDGVSGVGNISDRSISAENMTSEYVDAQERLRSAKKEKEALEELLDKADSLDEIIRLRDKLAELDYQMESAQATMNSINLDVAYSTVDVNLVEVSHYTTTPVTFFEKIKDAIIGSWRVFINFVQYTLIFLIYALPIVAFVGALLLLAYILYGKFYDKFRKKFPKKPKKQIRFAGLNQTYQNPPQPQVNRPDMTSQQVMSHTTHPHRNDDHHVVEHENEEK